MDNGFISLKYGGSYVKPSGRRCIRASRAPDLSEQPRLDRGLGTAINHLIKGLRLGFNELRKWVLGVSIIRSEICDPKKSRSFLNLGRG